MITTDKIGNTLEQGDKIVFSKMGDDDVHFGTVEQVLLGDLIKVRRKSTNRVSANARRGCEVLNINHLSEVFPEFMV